MSSNKPLFIAVILAVVFAALALFAFTRQQQSATSEATAIANANAVATSQAISDSGQQTAVAQANMQATGQAEAQHNAATAVAQVQMQSTAQAEAQNGEATAVAQANMQATAQADAQRSEAIAIAQANVQATGQAQAEAAEGTTVAHATAEANAAMTARAISQAAQADAEENAQLAATEAQNQAATATFAMGQAEIAQTAAAAAIDSAATSSAQQESAQATGTMIQQQNTTIRQTATAQARALQATQTLVAQAAGTLPEGVTPVMQISQHPNDTMNFLVANKAIGGIAGRLGGRITTKIDLVGSDDWMLWETFSGNYSDFVVSADIGWLGDATEAECGFVLREKDEENLYVVVIDRTGYMNFQRLEDNEWFDDYAYQSNSTIHTRLDDINHLVVVAQNDEFQVFINGQPAGYYVGSVYDEGQVGLMGAKFNESDQAGCVFNNAWVWDLTAGVPTPTPIPPTAVPTTPPELSPFPVPLLSKTFTYSDGSFSVKYPSWWIVDQLVDGMVTLSSSSDAGLLLFGGGTNEIFLTVGASPKAALQGMPLEYMLENNASDLSSSFGEGFSLEFEEPEAFQLGDYDAFRIVGKSDDFDAEVILFEKGDGFVFVLALCGSGQLRRCEPTVHAIAETVNYMSKNA